MQLSRRAAKQILAFGSLAGFFGVTAAVLVLPNAQKIDLVFAAWLPLITMVMKDYFGERDETPGDS